MYLMKQGNNQVPIDQQGKSMMIRKVINEIQDQLNIYNKNSYSLWIYIKIYRISKCLKENNVYPQHLKMQMN